MSNYVRGEEIILGIGMEDSANRGTWVSPQMWVPGRMPTSLKSVPEIINVAETRATGMDAQETEIILSKSSGTFEFNIRFESFGFFLKSYLGKVTSSGIESGVYEHTFEVLGEPQHPSLSASLSMPNVQDYKYPLAIISSLEIRTPIDDLVNATVGIESDAEVKAGSDFFTPTFETTDYRVRHQDITIKIAATEAGLDAAEAISLKSFNSSHNGNVKRNQNVGELSGVDIITGLHNMELNFSSDYLDETYRDMIEDNDDKALRIEMKRSDITIGSSNNPTIQINYPKVNLTSRDQDRPLDDIVVDTCTAKVLTAPNAVVTNEREDYNNE